MKSKLLLNIFFSVLVISFILFLFLFSLATFVEVSSPFLKIKDRPLVERNYFVESKYGWSLKPNLLIQLISLDKDNLIYFSTDHNGYRTTPKFVKNSKTGVVLGDSMAQGYFLTDEETLPYRVAQLLNNNVINTGVGGYSTDQQLMVLNDIFLKKEKIDWVLHLFFANDLPYNNKNKAWGLFKPKYEIIDSKINFKKIIFSSKSKKNTTTVPPPVEFCCEYNYYSSIRNIYENFFEYSKLLISKPWSLITKIKKDLMFHFPSDGQYGPQLANSYYENPQKHEKEFNIAFQMMNQMKNISIENDAKFTVMFVPEISYFFDKSSKYDLFINEFFNYCNLYNINCINPIDDFKKDPKSMYVMDDGHLAPLGVDTLAMLFAQNLNTLGLNSEKNKNRFSNKLILPEHKYTRVKGFKSFDKVKADGIVSGRQHLPISALDGRIETFWEAYINYPSSLSFKKPTGKIKEYSFYIGTNNPDDTQRFPKKWKLEYSVDGVLWKNLHQVKIVNELKNNSFISYKIPDPKEGSFYRFIFEEGDAIIRINNIYINYEYSNQ